MLPPIPVRFGGVTDFSENSFASVTAPDQAGIVEGVGIRRKSSVSSQFLLFHYESMTDPLLLPPPLDDFEETEEEEFSETVTYSATSVIARLTTVPDPVADHEGLHSAPTLPGYRILKRLGAGGMGMVYLAEEIALGREVAIKTLRTAIADDSEVRDRFRSEAEAAARLRHPHIAQVYRADVAGEVPFFAMEFVPGTDLETKIARSPQAPRWSAELLRTLADAIAHCHESGIVHRDLKPSNVLLTKDDFPKLTDFGIARLYEAETGRTRTGEILGTPSYMAPEQAAGTGRRVGPATDVYGLGAIFYTLLTGRPPHRGADLSEILVRVISEDPVSPRRLETGIPRDLETICLRCLHKSPDRRYPSARKLADDLDRYLRGEPIHARAISRSERLLKWSRRHPGLATGIGISALALAIIIGGAFWYGQQLASAASDNKDLADQRQIALNDLQVETDRATRLARQRKAELDRTQRLLTNGQKLARWVSVEHTRDLESIPGGTAIQEKLARRLEQYLATTAPDAGEDPKFLNDMAMVYQRLADVQGYPFASNLGQPGEARKNYITAIALRDRALAAEPDHPEWRWEQADARIRLADVLLLIDGEGIESARAQVAGLKETLATIEAPPEDTWRKLSVEIMLRDLLARLAEAENDFDGMAKLLTEGLALCDQLAEEPNRQRIAEFRRQLLLSLRGELEMLAGDYDEAEQTFRAALASLRGIRETEANHADHDTDVAQLLVQHGDALMVLGQLPEAQKNYAEALDIHEQQLAADRDNYNYRVGVAVALSRESDVLLALEKPEDALPKITRAVEMRRQFVAEQPEDRERRIDLIKDLGSLLPVQMSLGNYAAGRETARERLTEIERIEKDEPDNPEVAALIGEAALFVAFAEYPFYNEALDKLADQSEPQPISSLPSYQSLLAHCDRSIAAWDKLEKMASLSESQKVLQRNAKTLRDTVQIAE